MKKTGMAICLLLAAVLALGACAAGPAASSPIEAGNADKPMEDAATMVFSIAFDMAAGQGDDLAQQQIGAGKESAYAAEFLDSGRDGVMLFSDDLMFFTEDSEGNVRKIQAMLKKGSDSTVYYMAAALAALAPDLADDALAASADYLLQVQNYKAGEADSKPDALLAGKYYFQLDDMDGYYFVHIWSEAEQEADPYYTETERYRLEVLSAFSAGADVSEIIGKPAGPSGSGEIFQM
ncbi:MAG: hypothetical protein ACOYJB_07660 [Christensenellaceae bacterium]|jgi:hypothetical protein